MTRRMISRPGTFLARLGILVVAGYLSQVSEMVFTPKDRLIGIPGFDARPLFFVGTILGVIFAFEPKVDWLRYAWLVVFTTTALGRALSLLFVGSPDLDRDRELAGFTVWMIILICGLLSTLVLTASTIHDTE
jgi:hypothetical protein